MGEQKQLSGSGEELTLKRRHLRLVSFSYGFKVSPQLALFRNVKILLYNSQDFRPEELKKKSLD